MKTYFLFGILVPFFVFLAGCASAPAATPVVTPSNPPSSATSAPSATHTPTPTVDAAATTFVQTMSAELTQIAPTPTVLATSTRALTNTPVTSTTAQPLNTPATRGLGIAREKVQVFFQVLGFTFSAGAPVNGQDNVVGYSADARATMQLIGPAENLNQISVTAFIEQNNDDANKRAIVYLVGVLAAVLPEWDEAGKWLTDAIPTAISGTPVTITQDNIRTRLEAPKGMGALQLVVEGAQP